MVSEFEKIRNKILLSIDEYIGKEFINNKSLQLTFFKEVGVKPSRSLSKTTYSGIADTLSALQSKTNYFSDEEIYDTFDSVDSFETLKEYLDSLFNLNLDEKKLLNLYLDIKKILKDSSYEYINKKFEQEEKITEEVIKQEIERKERREQREIEIIKISEINIKHFKGIKNELKIETENKSLLIFGENGTGKSSIFEAFNITLDQIGIHSNENKGYFKIYDNIFTNNQSDIKIKHNAKDKTILLKHCLNYKDLLHIHFISNNLNNNSDLFEFILRFLHLFKSPTYDKEIITIIKEIEILKDTKNKTKKEITINSEKAIDMQNKLELDINQIITNNVKDINYYLNKLTNEEINIKKLSFNLSEKKVNLELTYKGKEIKLIQISYILNEAKLSALALSIYFAIIKNTHYSPHKIFLLDDLLISLDYEHRLPLIEILLEDFNNNQIILLTHDKKWFEIMKKRIEIKNNTWKFLELIKIDEVVQLKNFQDYLDKAKDYLQTDKRISGIYCRLEFERLLELLFSKNKIPISCYSDNKFKLPTLGDFSNSLNTDKYKLLEYIEKINFDYCNSLQSQIKNEEYSNSLSQLKKIKSDLLELKDVKILIDELMYFKDIILNNSSHNNDEWYFKTDIDNVIIKLEELKQRIEQIN